MATITGSSTIDWSGISLAQVDFETNLLNFIKRVDAIFTDLGNTPPETNTVLITPTLIVVDLVPEGSLSLRGSGFFGTSPFIINSFNYNNIGTGEVVRWTGTWNGGNELITSATLESPGFSETFKGNVIIPVTFPDAGNITGTLTSLVVKIGSATGTFSGNFSLTGNLVSASLTGTVTGISIVSGDNTITMTGLALSLDVLEVALASGDLATVNDLFSVVGNLMAGNDTLTYANNSGAGMTFYGGAGNDTITISGPNADTLNGGAGNDTLNGGDGIDTLIGGAGDDIYIHDGVADTIVENPGEGSDTIRAAVSFTLPDPSQNIENLTLTGTGNINGTGNAIDNILTGNSGNNVLSGGAGNDAMRGGLGNDTYTVDSAGDVVTEALNAGTDLVQSSAASFTLGANVENLTLTGAALNGTGNSLANVLTGNNGVNILTGGAGNDTYIVQNDADSVVEILNAGIDLVQSTAANFTLGANVENLTLLGGTDINGTGNTLANIITGNSGVNILTGGAGNDVLDGGADNDTLNAGDGNDVILIGNAADHGGGEGIIGGLGTDVIRFTSTTSGQSLILASGITTVESVVIGTAAGLTTGTTALDVDASNVATGLTLTGNAGANVLTGTNANDTLNGGAGNDTLDGGDGTNLLLGGTGNDGYVVDALTDVVSEGLNAGTDTVLASLNYTLTANVENLELTGTALIGTGNALNNILTGTGGANTLSGLAGNDTLSGGAGHDTVSGGVGNDSIVMLVTAGNVDTIDAGAAGTDTLLLSGVVGGNGVVVVDLSLADQVVSIAGDPARDTLTQTGFENLDASGLGSSVNATGSAGANIIIGSNGADTINGGAGNDTLDGGAGDDTMDGGAGNDTYMVNSLGDTVTETLAGAAGGTDLVQSAVNITLVAGATNVENLTLTGADNLNGTGNAFNNILTGNSGNNQLSGLAGTDTLTGGVGNDHLDGGAGTDKMAGGVGDDTYVVASAGDVVTEGLNAGTDMVQSSITYKLGANVENLTLTGSALNGTGNTLNNILTGNSGNNQLSGLAGNDTLIGGDGNDLLLGGLGTDTVTGGVGDDQITMLVTANNVDTIDAGADTDTLVLSGVVPGNHVVVVDLSSSTDQVVSIGGTPDNTLIQKNFENLNASGIGSSVDVTGSDGDNILVGSNGNDSMTGGLGDDTMIGGLGVDNLQGGTGNDLFLIGSTSQFAAGEVVDGGDGTDTLRYTGNAAATLTLTNLVTNIEQVQIANAAGLPTGLAAINVNAAAVANGLTIIGNNGANVLTGTSEADTLTGNGGNDTLRGGLGDDTYQVNRGNGQDTISENDSTSGNSDTLLYGATINPLDLVLSRQANDLRLAIHGSTERVTIKNWFSSPGTAQVETIQAGGQALLNTQVDQLIQAMATFTQNTGLTWDQGIEQQPVQVQNILAASWQ
jgi:trimeric autotransporter adhesin